jgi:pimeloyl-ACP methyl ester carboxylesterase
MAVESAQQLELRLPDGRLLEFAVEGPPQGLPLIFHYGTPSAGLPFPQLSSAAARHGLRTVVYSRAGYSRSSPRPGRSVADVVPDVEAILAEVGASDFITLGWSGGGPHALACAALLPDWCLAAATIAGVAPHDAAGLDWTAGMGPENIEEFGLALAGEESLTPWLTKAAAELATVQASDVAAALGGLVSQVDRDALSGQFAELLAACFRAAVSNGVDGWRDDDLAFVRDWGFDLSQIHVPVAVWQGGQDRMVPFTHGQWLAEHILGAQSRLFAEEGHLSLAVNALDRIVGDLVALARR